MPVKSSAWPLLFALLLGVGALFAPRPAQAVACWYDWTYTQQFYGDCITEPTQILNNSAWVQNVITDGDKYKNWVDQVRKLEDRFNQLDVGGFNLGEQTGMRVDVPELGELSERSRYEGESNCKLGKSSVAQKQLMLCKQMATIRNLKYNAMLQVIKDMTGRDQKIRAGASDRMGLTGGKDIGRLMGNTNYLAQMKTGTKNELQHHLALMEGYDSMLKALDEQMTLTAQEAMTNKKIDGVLGNIIQGGALQAGLKMAQKREL